MNQCLDSYAIYWNLESCKALLIDQYTRLATKGTEARSRPTDSFKIVSRMLPNNRNAWWESRHLTGTLQAKHF